MPTMPAREKSRPRARGSTDDEFVVFLQGIPAHCRWQELKDLVRQTALHIRQAVVYDDHHGFPTGLGQIIVKNEEEAWRTYHRLSSTGWEGRSLVVTLSKTCAPTHPIAGPTKSPFFPSAAAAAAAAATAAASSSPSASSTSSAGASVSAPTSVAGYTPVSGYTTPPSLSQQIPPEPYLPTPEYTPIINLAPFIPVYPDLDPIYFYSAPANAPGTTSVVAPAPAPAPGAVTPTPTPASAAPAVTYPQYPTTPTPTPYRPKPQPVSNGHNGSNKQTRTILIQNLSPTVSQDDLLAVFHEAGPIESSHVDATGDTETLSATTTGTATTARITYTNADAAKRAVALFNSASLGPGLPLYPGSRRLRVRLERFSTFTPASPSPSAPATAPGSKDKETTGVDSRRDCQPLVVNGSGVGKRAIIA